MANNFNTLGDTTTRIIRKKESRAINEGYTGAVAMPEGTVVKLDVATGKLTPVTAVTDVPFGVLEVGCRAADSPVTVFTPFVAIVRGKADGALTIGDKVAASGMDNANEHLTTYKKAVATNYVVGVALGTVGSGSTAAWIGVYRVPSLLPMA